MDRTTLSKTMKKKIILTILFLICLNIASASITLSEYKCEDERCREGTEITFRVGILNNINKTIRVNDLIIQDRDTVEPIYTYEHEGIFLDPGEEEIFEFTEIIIPPKTGYTHYYIPCFKTSIWVDGQSTGGGTVCDKAVKDFTVLPLSKIECEDDSECGPNEYCDAKFFKCKQEEPIVIQPDEKSGKFDNLKYYLLTAFVVVFVVLVSYWLIIREK